MDSDHERRERILDLCPNFEGETHSDQRVSMQRNVKRGTTPPYITADFVGYRRETKQTRNLSLTKTQELTDSQTTLERLNPPTADIRVSKSRK